MDLNTTSEDEAPEPAPPPEPALHEPQQAAAAAGSTAAPAAARKSNKRKKLPAELPPGWTLQRKPSASGKDAKVYRCGELRAASVPEAWRKHELKQHRQAAATSAADSTASWAAATSSSSAASASSSATPTTLPSWNEVAASRERGAGGAAGKRPLTTDMFTAAGASAAGAPKRVKRTEPPLRWLPEGARCEVEWLDDDVQDDDNLYGAVLVKHLGPASWPDGSRAARVRYHGLVEEDDPTQALEETVALATLRPEPPPHDAAAFAADLLPGVRASVYDAEVCSWEGVLVLSAVPAAGAKYRSAAYRVRRVDGDATVDLSQLRPMWDCYEKRGSAKQPGWWNRTAQDAKVARKQEARAGRRGGGAAAGAGAAGAGGAAGTSAAGEGAMPGVAQEASCSSEQTAEAAGEEAPRPPPLPPPPPLQPHDDDEDDSDESEMVAEEVEVEVEQQEPPPDAHGGPPPPAPPPQAAPPPPIPPPVPPPAPPPPVAHGSAACPIVLE